MRDQKIVLSQLYLEAKNKIDFEEIHSFMKVTNRKWKGELPSVSELSRVCDELFAALDHDRLYYRTSTGGFVLTYFHWHSCIELYLDFTLEHSSAHESLD